MSRSSELQSVIISDTFEISPGSYIGDGSYLLNERTSFIVARSDFPELPWEERAYLPGPDGTIDQQSFELSTGSSTHLRAWSAYYSSSFYISSCAGRGAHGEVWRGVTTDSIPINVVLKRIYSSRGSPSIPAAMREVYYGKRIGQNQPFASRYISHFVENDDLWLVFYDEGISLYQSIFHPTIVGQLSVMTRSQFWRHLRQYSHTVLGHVFRQIFIALDRLHTDKHIVHRDIKLENIFIDIAHSHVRIGDFGSASPFPKNESTMALFPPNGPTLDEETSRYAPPESVTGDVTERPPSFDMWCVGIMWVELWLGTVNLLNDLCVRTPDCTQEIFAKQIRKLDPFGVGFDDDPAMLDIVWRLVRFDPTQRLSAQEALRHEFFNHDRFALTLPSSRRIRSFKISSASSIGSRSQMEDRLLAIDTVPGGVFACVFDGHNGPEVADMLRFELTQKFSSFVNFPSRIHESIRSLIETVVKKVDKSDFENQLVGSTLTCIAVAKSGEYLVANIGDSRAVVADITQVWEPAVGARVRFGEDQNITGTVSEILQNGKIILIVPDDDLNRKKAIKRESVHPIGLPLRVTQITRDHKPEDLIERQYIESKKGKVSVGPPARVQEILAVSRSIGARSLKPFVRSDPEFFNGQVSRNTKKFLLATDGIWDVLSNHNVCSYTIADDVIRAATTAGARDNMVVIMIEIDPDDVCVSD